MRRIIIAAILIIGAAVAANAQPRAIGGRFGYSGLEASYQHTLGGSNFIEADLGLDYIWGIGFKTTGTYNFMIAQPAWTSRGEWGLYAGPGISLGYVGDKVKYRNKAQNGTSSTYTNFGKGFMLAVAAQAGLEYTFWFPLQLSVDIRPYFGIHVFNGKYTNGNATITVQNAKKTGFYDYGMFGFVPTFSVRYRF